MSMVFSLEPEGSTLGDFGKGAPYVTTVSVNDCLTTCFLVPVPNVAVIVRGYVPSDLPMGVPDKLAVPLPLL